MVYCKWCDKWPICPSRREGITICGDFVAAPGAPDYHYEVIPPEEVVDD
jgi:hypothetical protein